MRSLGEIIDNLTRDEMENDYGERDVEAQLSYLRRQVITALEEIDQRLTNDQRDAQVTD
jgi:hypothetical protein